eukprot:7287527-Lingulodinium_polyedra.AAC.1
MQVQLSGCVFHRFSNPGLKAYVCVCAEDAPHGVVWGNSSVYGREAGVGSIRPQHETEFSHQ